MIYLYNCESCGKPVEIAKPVSAYDKPEQCEICGEEMVRLFTRTQLFRTSVQERNWQPAFGKVMTQSEARAEAKARGMVEVGNEDPKKHIKPKDTHYDDV